MKHSYELRLQQLSTQILFTTTDDFQVLVSPDLPKPAELQREGAWLQYLGQLKGSYIYLKRTFGCILAAIIYIGGVGTGAEYIYKYTPIIYSHVEPLVRRAAANLDKPATKYVLAVPCFASVGNGLSSHLS